MTEAERYMVILEYADGTRDMARDADQEDLPWVSTSRLAIDQAATRWQEELGATCRVQVVRQTECRFSIDGEGRLSIDVEAKAVVG